MILNNQRTALFVSTIASFMTPFMGSSVNIALPRIGSEFSMDAISLGWVATSYILAAAIFLVPFGRVADIFGRKKIFLYGIVVHTLASFLIVISHTSTLLIVFRAVQGIGGAMIFGTGVAILTSVYPAYDRGRVLGINVASVYLGLSLGPFAGGSLTQHLGWRSVFIVNVVLGLFISALVIWKLKSEWAEARGESFDFIGSILYSISLTLIMYGFSELPALTGAWTITVGVIGFISFIVWESKSQNPILNLNLFRHNAVFTFSNLAALINYSATFAVTFLLSLYFQYIKGFPPQTAGLILVAQPVMMTIFSPVAGRLSDRIEPRVVASIGMTFSVIGLGLFILVNQDTAIVFEIFNLILLGFGFALFSSPNTNAVMSSVEKKYYGVAAATLGTMRLTGQMLSMGIVILIFAVKIGKVTITPEYFPRFMISMRTAFIIFSVMCVAGIFASLARGRVR